MAPTPQVEEQPLYVFTGSNCPSRGTESDLAPNRFEGLALVRFRVVEECSGAGGEWLVGRDESGVKDFFVGEHACFFLPPDLRDQSPERFGLVRYSTTAALHQTPEGVCVTDADGQGPVMTELRSIAWGVYRSEEGARAALARLEPQQ